MLEKYGLYLLLVGALLGAVGLVWLVVRAFRTRVLWGLALVLFPPSAILFIAINFRKSLGPVLLLLPAVILVGLPYGLSYYERNFARLKPHEQIVDGELRITLTGLKGFDYTTLKDGRQVVVLQMANDDVNDQTLEHLRGLDRLRKLDLGGTGITDEGLAAVATLPQLQELYLARTRITDEGFVKHLMPKESLLRVDLTGTEVKGKTKRAWKMLRPEEREYVD